jgi:hypothetical protein
VALGDSADGSVPLAWFSVSTDGGRTWADPPRQRLTDVSSMAVASDGTTIVSGAGRAFLYGTRSGYSEPGRPIGVVFAAGDQLCATSYGQDKGPMLCSGDDGVTWQETTLPGLG